MTDGVEDGGELDELREQYVRLQREFAEVQRLGRLGSWEWDVTSDTVRWSDELYRIFGLEPGQFEATYAAYLDQLHPDDREMIDQTVQEAYRTGRGYAFDHRLVRPDGAVRWVHGRGSVEMSADGLPTRLYGITIDITDRRRMEAVLREFVATAAHELRTPVASIIHALELLGERGEGSGADETEVFNVLVDQADRLRELSESLLDLTAVNTRISVVHLEAVELQAAVHRAVEATDVGESEIITDVDPGLFVQADSGEIHRVIAAVVTTCSGRDARSIEISSVDGEHEVALVVRHDGKPLAEMEIDELFLPLVRRAAQEDGGSAGLAVAARLMAAFGGRLEHQAGDDAASFVLRFVPTMRER